MDEKQKQYEKNRKNGVALNFRVSDRISKTLDMIAEQKGISRSEVCRQQLEGLVYQPPLFSKEDSEQMKYDLKKIGNNMNQATKNLNKLTKYFQEKSEIQTKTSLSVFDSDRFQLFQDERANIISKKLRITKIDEIFSENTRNHFRYSELSEQEQEYFNYFVSINKRPATKEEYSHSMLNGLKQSIEIIQEFKQESKKLWELL